MHMLIQSTPSYCDTTLVTFIRKPMDLLEVYIIDGLCILVCRNFPGEDPKTPFHYNTTRLSIIKAMKAIELLFKHWNAKVYLDALDT